MHGSNFSRYNFKLNNETRKRFDSSSICNGCLLNNNFNFRNKVKKEIEIMTPKEKAKELVEKMFSNMPKYLQGKIGSETAKQCALICVGEIIGIPSIQTAYAQGYNKSKSTESYWQEVKQEINKL